MKTSKTILARQKVLFGLLVFVATVMLVKIMMAKTIPNLDAIAGPVLILLFAFSVILPDFEGGTTFKNSKSAMTHFTFLLIASLMTAVTPGIAGPLKLLIGNGRDALPADPTSIASNILFVMEAIFNSILLVIFHGFLTARFSIRISSSGLTWK